MTTVVVLPNNQDGKHFRAVSGENESFGETIGAALDALTGTLKTPQRNALVYIQDFCSDEFFTEAQQLRLADLMGKWRNKRESLSLDEQTELEKLIEAELESSGKRAEKLANQLGK